MPYWTLRTELDDAPGRLAGISGAIATAGGNIVALDVHPLGRSSVADELVIQAPTLDPVALVKLVADAGGKRSTVTSSDPHELVDGQTRSLRLLHGLSLATGRRDAALEGALTVLLRADRCCLLPASAAGLGSLTERALSEGLPVMGQDSGGPYAAGSEPAEVLVVPWRESRGDVRLAVISRPAPAFTEIEGARARGFLLVAAVVAPKVPDRADLLLSDGTEVHLRPATALDADAVSALHVRSPFHAPTVPGVGALGRYPIWVRESLGSLNPIERYVLVAEHHGQICAVAGYERAPQAWTGGFGVLVDRRLPNRALGAALLRRLAQAASVAGLDVLTATVNSRRDVRLRAARASGLPVSERRSWEGRDIRIALPRESRSARSAMPARAEPVAR